MSMLKSVKFVCLLALVWYAFSGVAILYEMIYGDATYGIGVFLLAANVLYALVVHFVYHQTISAISSSQQEYHHAET